MFSKKSISIIFCIFVIPVLFNNCSAGKTLFGSTENDGERIGTSKAELLNPSI